MPRPSRSSAVSSSARLKTSAASFALRPDGRARLVAVADTHSLPHAESARRLAELQPDAILHAGDIGDLGVLADLEKIAPVFAVRGNIDTRAPGLPDVLTLDLLHDERAVARVLLLHIAVAGPRLRADAIRLAEEAQASLIVCGHSHVPFIAQQRGLTVFNPGSIGPRRFMLPIVFGTIDIQPTGIQLAHIDVETGQPWSPPLGRGAAAPPPTPPCLWQGGEERVTSSASASVGGANDAWSGSHRYPLLLPLLRKGRVGGAAASRSTRQRHTPAPRDDGPSRWRRVEPDGPACWCSRMGCSRPAPRRSGRPGPRRSTSPRAGRRARRA